MHCMKSALVFLGQYELHFFLPEHHALEMIITITSHLKMTPQLQNAKIDSFYQEI